MCVLLFYALCNLSILSSVHTRGFDFSACRICVLVSLSQTASCHSVCRMCVFILQSDDAIFHSACEMDEDAELTIRKGLYCLPAS